ncbi:cyclin-dependent kinase 2-associated protein 1 isoform X1 [Meriones unguiculatus]|uniref:cyclin-dependent kinase 2-associated protein 1 isoform X1 n=1 Tax=Meriones unguiculatus TaxID=10047 RepID=UPI00293EDB60|nr:cyclin-dependent kinase 2-associated protein 1 isoform X1 [Meriones unguiculatus]
MEVSAWLRGLCPTSSHAPTACPVPGGEGGPGPGTGQAEEAEAAGGRAEAQLGAAAQCPGHAAPALGEAGGQEADVPGGRAPRPGFQARWRGLGVEAAEGTGNSQVPQSKYAELLAIIEELGKEIRPTYAGSKSAMERLKRGIIHARSLVRECLAETERNARS